MGDPGDPPPTKLWRVKSLTVAREETAGSQGCGLIGWGRAKVGQVSATNLGTVPSPHLRRALAWPEQRHGDRRGGARAPLPRLLLALCLEMLCHEGRG